MNPVEVRCGPLQVRFGRDPHGTAARLHGPLGIYSAQWPQVSESVEVAVLAPEEVALPPDGSPYLDIARMAVTRCDGGLAARCEAGAVARYDRAGRRWEVGLPRFREDIWSVTDSDNLATLIVATGWREAGWVPLHAGLVCRDGGPAALLCATSGGGKSTLTLAMVRRGWKTLGDDKLLLREDAQRGGLEVHALVHSFNLFPHTRQWFPELAGIGDFPRCSVWTDKRRVPLEWLGADAARSRARPSHVVRVTRDAAGQGLRVHPLSAVDTLSVLMRQTVLPQEREAARSILRAVSALARQVVGLEVVVGPDAYRDPNWLDALEHALENGP